MHMPFAAHVLPVSFHCALSKERWGSELRPGPLSIGRPLSARHGCHGRPAQTSTLGLRGARCGPHLMHGPMRNKSEGEAPNVVFAGCTQKLVCQNYSQVLVRRLPLAAWALRSELCTTHYISRCDQQAANADGACCSTARPGRAARAATKGSR